MHLLTWEVRGWEDSRIVYSGNNNGFSRVVYSFGSDLMGLVGHCPFLGSLVQERHGHALDSLGKPTKMVENLSLKWLENLGVCVWAGFGSDGSPFYASVILCKINNSIYWKLFLTWACFWNSAWLLIFLGLEVDFPKIKILVIAVWETKHISHLADLARIDVAIHREGDTSC